MMKNGVDIYGGFNGIGEKVKVNNKGIDRISIFNSERKTNNG
jgi:hypothetical protein